jgi:hypothetical protein
MMGRRSAVRDSLPTLAVHGLLAAFAVAALVLQWMIAARDPAPWALAQLPVGIAGLVFAWRYQERLSLRWILILTLAFRLGSILVFRHLGYAGDQDPNAVYLSEGHALLHGNYPASEYPVAAVFLFAFEAAVNPSPPQVANALTLLPFILICVCAIWSLRTRWSPWLATCIGLWPLDAYYWQFRYDGIAAALLAVGILLAVRERFAWSGAALAVGACFKWTPGLSAIGIAVWLVHRRSHRPAARLTAGFLAAGLLIYVPALLRWPAHDVLASFQKQSVRQLTGESIWYWPARALGLTHGIFPEWASAGAPHWVDVVVTVLQVAILVAVVAVGLRRRSSASTMAALLPVLFLCTNRVFSPQFVLVVAVGMAIVTARSHASRREELAMGLGIMLTSGLNVFVYPWNDPFHRLSWGLFAALSWMAIVPAVLLALRLALRTGPSTAARDPAAGTRPADLRATS